MGGAYNRKTNNTRAFPKKRKLTPKVEEVNFDSDARQEWLTGFHKRKVQRAKEAQEVAIEKMKEEKRHDRAKVWDFLFKPKKSFANMNFLQLREERAADMKRIMEEHKSHLKRMKAEFDSDSDSNADEGSDEEEWGGIEEPPAVDYEAEYVDEDKYTTVTVEEMDTSRDGLRNLAKGDDSEEEEEKPATKTPEAEAKPEKKFRKTTQKPKQKKKQFRYESKSDRKITASKQRSSNSRKAKARREE
ncbi:Protein required for cell viability Rrp17 [Penicillium verhagenii]|uniref:Protein required for cell viability Rrp17 n=1 Tax=Penicillium verhagenii TaxID=1562060 RepID=UPI00254543F5|nr:Protein required for cell viability Rrp17 [Penicillium verhagenii]KAJ5915501.1 Protein required for cell viability Rrp17 [Penicillium verhagenii]